MKNPSIAIIILCWNGKEDTIECLKSLQHLDYPRYRVLVVDNASTDGTAEAVKIAFPDIEVIRNDRNLGFAGGNNVGIGVAMEMEADAVLLLNNDTVVAPEFLSVLADALYSSPDFGAANPLIYYYDSPDTIWSAGGTVDAKTGIAYQKHIDEVDVGQIPQQTIDYAVGAAVLIKREALEEIGLLDECFYLYYEETEWCYRAADAGFRTILVPTSKIWHKISRSFNGASALQLYYLSRNRLLFMNRRGRSKAALLGIAVGEYLRMSASMIARGKKEQGKAVMRGVFDFFFGRLGRAPL